MAVFMTGAGFAPNYSRDPIIVYAAGDTALRYGKFIATGMTNAYWFNSSALNVYDQHNDAANCVAIEVDATGYNKLIITSYTENSRNTASKVGWGVSYSGAGALGQASSVLTKTSVDYEFDISGQTTIYIGMYSETYAAIVTGIRLE